MRTVVACFSCLMICAASYSQQSADLLPRAKEEATRLGNIQRHWGAEMNSPGVEISLKETGRREVGGRTAVMYRIFATGFSEDGIYTLTTTGLNLNVSTALEGITLDKSGQAVCAGRPGTCSSDVPNDPVDLAIFAARGEPKRFGFVSQDGRTKAFISVIPFPIAGTDRGCSVEAILLTPNAEAMLIHGSGFGPDSAVHSMAISENGKQEGDLKSDATGNVYEIQLLPYSAGTSKVTLTSKSCSPSLSYHSGKGTYRMQ